MTIAQPATTAPAAVKIFGREPAVFLGLAEATLALFVVLVGAQVGLTGEFTAVALAVVSAGVGVYSAVATKDTLLGVGTGLVKAVIGLALYFGLDLSMEAQASLVAFTAAAVGFFQRTQTSPIAAPVDPSPTQVAESPVEVRVDGRAIAAAPDRDCAADFGHDGAQR